MKILLNKYSNHFIIRTEYDIINNINSLFEILQTFLKKRNLIYLIILTMSSGCNKNYLVLFKDIYILFV